MFKDMMPFEILGSRHGGQGVRPFPLEDIAVALWVRDLMADVTGGEAIHMVEEQRFGRLGLCVDTALNVLLERGCVPLPVDTARRH